MEKLIENVPSKYVGCGYYTLVAGQNTWWIHFVDIVSIASFKPLNSFK